jgi:hypothetical protein
VAATRWAVSGSALLLTTTISSTTPVAKKPSMVSLIDPFSAYVIRTTDTVFECHIGLLATGRSGAALRRREPAGGQRTSAASALGRPSACS